MQTNIFNIVKLQRIMKKEFGKISNKRLKKNEVCKVSEIVKEIENNIQNVFSEIEKLKEITKKDEK